MRIGLATPANGRQHQPSPARINYGVCASAGQHRRRPTAGGISLGLHASDVADAHLASDVDQRQAASTKRHWSWTARIG